MVCLPHENKVVFTQLGRMHSMHTHQESFYKKVHYPNSRVRFLPARGRDRWRGRLGEIGCRVFRLILHTQVKPSKQGTSTITVRIPLSWDTVTSWEKKQRSLTNEMGWRPEDNRQLQMSERFRELAKLEIWTKNLREVYIQSRLLEEEDEQVACLGNKRFAIKPLLSNNHKKLPSLYS